MELINRLVEGNTHFRKTTDPALLGRLARGQSPSVAILACSDSRVAPERIFGLSMGDAFVVRVAGYSCSGAEVLGSLEYAVTHLNVPALVVLGHTGCGAVSAALAGERMDNLASVARDIERARRMTSDGRSNDLDEVAEANVRLQLRLIQDNSPVIRDAVSRGRLTVIGAFYDIATGAVRLLDGVHAQSKDRAV